ncbi:MAG: PHP domain-containing protein [Desulfatitalea sp.]|nr:hypothetical protein [Desulfatitalea sp.]NNJ99790.1 PHP domain-containing protein [Desulfatitalea sp.]
MTTILPSWPYRIDLHVHTRRYSPCAEAIDPENLPRIMADTGLSGLVLTEHDTIWPMHDVKVLNRRLPHGRIYTGVEVSTRNGHFIVIGITSLHGITPGMTVHALVALAQAREAAVIWAHPHFNYENTMEPLPLDRMAAGIHAVEVAGISADTHIHGMAHRMGWTVVAGSDAHCPSCIGRFVTHFSQMPENEKALAAAIRQGRCAT